MKDPHTQKGEDPDNDEPQPEYHYCRAYLDPWFDWHCARCLRLACNDCSQECRQEGCGEIACSSCVGPHELETHAIRPGPGTG